MDLFGPLPLVVYRSGKGRRVAEGRKREAEAYRKASVEGAVGLC